MDKILISPDGKTMQVTNDGATILKSIHIDNPAAKILVEISKVQDDEIGDGTTSVCVLAAELLRQSERLIGQRIHPQTIIEGFRLATAAARSALEASAKDNRSSTEVFHQDLFNIAKTTLSSKVLAQHRDHFSRMAVDAVLQLGEHPELDRIHVVKKIGGRLVESFLADGLILDKRIGVNQVKRLENAKILLANTPMDTDKVKVFGAQFRVESTGQLAELERAEREKMRSKVQAIQRCNINCFVNRQLIYNWPEQLFTDAGIVSVEHADFEGIERLALVTGGEVASTFDDPESIKPGRCDLVEEIMIGEDTMVKFSGGAGGSACTIVLRGATQQLLEEAERSMHDALCVISQTIKEPKTVLGGGCSETLMAEAIERELAKIEGKAAYAAEAFAMALRKLPEYLCDNAGFDSAELVAQLRTEHRRGNSVAGLNMADGTVSDVSALGVTESLKLKRQVLTSAAEAAEMILRVDHIIKSAPRKRERH